MHVAVIQSPADAVMTAADVVLLPGREGYLPATATLLVAGNHDRSISRLPQGIGIDSVLRTLDEPPFHFVHEPGTPLPEPDRDEPFTIASHLHPTLAIRAPSGERIADRCFYAEPRLLVLPAFGSFTGGHRVSPTERMQLWIARDDGVAIVTRLARQAARPVQRRHRRDRGTGRHAGQHPAHKPRLDNR